jgi:acyl-coenzyme A thioesterase PaaI-like protein
MKTKQERARPPQIVPEADWETVRLPFNIGSGRSIYSGLEADDRLRLRVFRKKSVPSIQGQKQNQTSHDRLVGRVWFGPGTDGPPGHVHGGATAYVLDEAMGSVGWMNDYPVVAAKLEFQYKQMAPMETDLIVEAEVLSATDRKIEVEARLRLPTGEITVVSHGVFVRLPKSRTLLLAQGNQEALEILSSPSIQWAAEDES